MRNLIHDVPAERIVILDDRFYSQDNITFYPSVTTILEAYPKGKWFDDWVESVGGMENAKKIRDKAGESGSAVHNAIELIEKGQEVRWADDDFNALYSLEEWQAILNYLDFREKVQPTIIALEQKLCSPTMRCGGTLDWVMEFGQHPTLPRKKRWLTDTKTSNNLSPTFPLQLSAYAKMWNEAVEPEWHVDDVCTLWLKSKVRTEKIDHVKGIWQGQHGNVKKQMIDGFDENCPRSWQIITYDRPWQESFKVFEHCRALWEETNPNYKPKNLLYPDRVKLSV